MHQMLYVPEGVPIERCYNREDYADLLTPTPLLIPPLVRGDSVTEGLKGEDVEGVIGGFQ